jgi:hypothetical protein
MARFCEPVTVLSSISSNISGRQIQGKRLRRQRDYERHARAAASLAELGGALTPCNVSALAIDVQRPIFSSPSPFLVFAIKARGTVAMTQ